MSAVPTLSPPAWPAVPISEVADLVRGVSYPNTDARDEPAESYVPVLRATNIQDARLVLEADLVHIAERNVSPVQLLRQGDIVVATSSGSKHLVGKSAQLHGAWHGSFGAFCAAIRPKSHIESRYLALFLQSPGYWRQVSKKALGVNINNLRRGDLETLLLPLPPVDVQRIIVAEIEKQFSRLDEAVANLKRVKANLKRHAAAVLGTAVSGMLVATEAAIAEDQAREFETGEELLRRSMVQRKSQWQGAGKFTSPVGPKEIDLPPLPQGWTWASAVQACDAVVDCHNKTAPYVEKGIPLVRTTNIRDGRLIPEGMRFVDQPTYEFWSRRCPPQAGDVLFTREAPMGEAAIIPSGLKICLGQRTMLMRPSLAIDKGFLLAALLSPVIRRQIDRVAVGSGVKHLRVGDVERLPIPIPPLAEQRRIVAEVDRRLSIVREVEAEVDANLKRAQALQQAVLARSFGG